MQPIERRRDLDAIHERRFVRIAPLDPDAPTLSRSIVGSQPISGECTTAFAPPAFPPPLTFRQVDVGTCQLTHLGRVAIYSVQDIDIVAGTQTSVIDTYTAANGDVLRVVNVGSNTPNGTGASFSATTTIVGGTGRFAHATGQAHVEGSASFITNTGDLHARRIDRVRRVGRGPAVSPIEVARMRLLGAS